MFEGGNHVRLEVIPTETKLLLVSSLRHFCVCTILFDLKEVLNGSDEFSSICAERSFRYFFVLNLPFAQYEKAEKQIAFYILVVTVSDYYSVK
jgi:hypothetical protein